MSFMILELIQYFFIQIVLNTITQISKLFSTSKFPFHRISLNYSKIFIGKTRDHDSHEQSLRIEDVEVLMANLGVFRHLGDENLPKVLSCNDLFGIFEQEQPSLDEVKEAFGVFDENRDGFIDAGELQRVLFVLGLKESAKMEDCRKMIGAFDENADGRIDFNEFVKFMEYTYC